MTNPPANSAKDFKIIGYLPSWQGTVEEIQFDKLTHINYAFALPREIGDGNLDPLENPDKLRQLVACAHEQNTKVLISVGGWNDANDMGFERLAANADTINVFVDNMIKMVNDYDLDGVDIDWEYPEPGESGENCVRLMTALEKAMHSRGKLLTAAVICDGETAEGIKKPVFDLVDYLMIMSYDAGDPHANYEFSVSNVDYWQGRGLPASKTVLGVPFYGKPGRFSYREAIEADPENANRDCATVNGAYACYNGIPTIQRKADLMLQRGGGIMFWETSHDSPGDKSLLSAIYARMHSK